MKNRLFNNIGLKLLALISAIVIWILVVSINDPVADKTFRDVSVKILNEDVVTSEGKTYQIESGSGKATVTVRAQRSVLSKLTTSDLVVTADMKEMTLSSMIPIKASVRGYEGRYQRISTNPLNVQVRIEDIISNKFPITVSTSGELRDGYTVAGTEADPQTVTITGPQTVVRSIDHVVAKVSLTGVSADTTIKSDLVLYDADNREIDQSRLTNNIGDDGVSVDVQVYPTKTVPIRIDSEKIRTPDGYYLADINYEPSSVEIAADKATLREIEAIEIPPGAFDLRNVTGKTEVTLQIGSFLPDGVRLAGSDEERIAVTLGVARYGQRVFEYPPGSIVVNGLADDLQLEYTDNADLEITVRGPSADLQSLTLGKAISIDLGSYKKPGTYKVPVNVDLPDQYTAEQTKVTVKLSKKSN